MVTAFNFGWGAREARIPSIAREGFTHATADSSYARTEDGLSLAIARCDYLVAREAYRVTNPSPLPLALGAGFGNG
jgi:hypothetical protein